MRSREPSPLSSRVADALPGCRDGTIQASQWPARRARGGYGEKSLCLVIWTPGSHSDPDRESPVSRQRGAAVAAAVLPAMSAVSRGHSVAVRFVSSVSTLACFKSPPRAANRTAPDTLGVTVNEIPSSPGPGVHRHGRPSRSREWARNVVEEQRPPAKMRARSAGGGFSTNRRAAREAPLGHTPRHAARPCICIVVVCTVKPKTVAPGAAVELADVGGRQDCVVGRGHRRGCVAGRSRLRSPNAATTAAAGRIRCSQLPFVVKHPGLPCTQYDGASTDSIGREEPFVRV